MIDVIKSLYNKDITSDEAQSILDNILDRFHREKEPIVWAEEIGLSRYEATAYAQGASLDDIARFRYEGWPNLCSKCKRSIDYREYGWWIDHNEDGSVQFHHIKCPHE
jgi:hypothetical protein